MPRKPKTISKLTYELATRYAEADVQRWKLRQDRFEEEQDLLELKEFPVRQTTAGRENFLSAEDMPGAKRPGTEQVVLATPRILVDKVSRLMGRARKSIEYVGDHPDQTEKHQIIENLLRWMDREWKHRHAQGLHAPLQYEQGAFAAIRGWLVSRVTLNPNRKDKLPVLRTIHDAANIFPYEVGGRIVRVTERYHASVSDLLADPTMADGEEWLSTIEDHGMPITVSSVYTELADGEVYHCVIGAAGPQSNPTEGDFLKKPVKLGYMPWVVTLVQGSPYRQTPWDTTSSFISWMGTSVITPLATNFKYRNKLATMLMTVLANSANPPKTIFTDDEAATAEQLKRGFGAGDTVILRQADKVEFHRIGPTPGDFQMMHSQLMDIEFRGSMHASLFGDPSNVTSGIQSAIIKANALDYLFPLFEAMKLHEDLVLSKSLEIIAKFWPENMKVFVPAGANRPQGMLMDLSPEDIEQEGYSGVSVEFEDVTPEEFAKTATVWAMLVREKLASMKRARGRQGLKFDDPNLEDMEVAADLVKTDPQVIKFLVPFALHQTGQQLAARLYEQLHQEDLLGLMTQAAANAGIGAGNPAGGSGASAPVPAAVGLSPEAGFEQTPMLPGEVLPPAAQTGFQPGTVQPEVLQMLAAELMPFLVAGGVGGGGIPPAGGEGAFVPGPMLPGQ